METSSQPEKLWSTPEAIRLLGLKEHSSYSTFRRRVDELGIVFKPTDRPRVKGLNRSDMDRLAASFGVVIDWEAEASTKCAGLWIRGSEVATRLAIPRQHVQALAEKQRIRVLTIPGKFPRYHREDVERVLRDSIKVGGKPLPEGATV